MFLKIPEIGDLLFFFFRRRAREVTRGGVVKLFFIDERVDADDRQLPVMFKMLVVKCFLLGFFPR